MNPHLILRTAALFALCAASGCDFFQTAGGTSDTDNAVAVSGEIRQPDGSPAVACAIRLRRDDYLAPFPAFGKVGAGSLRPATDKANLDADTLGRFRIDSVDTGGYFVEAAQGDSLALLFRVDQSGRRALALDRGTLKPTAKVEGVVRFRPGTYRVFVQVYGLERMVPVDMATGRYSVTLPAGAFTLRFVDPERVRIFAKTQDVEVAAGQRLGLDTLALGDSSEIFAAWRHSSEMVLNTSSDGAGTAATLTGFPLLVRLDRSNFDFAQAGGRGEDVRFSKSDGKTALPHEIEHWDSAGGRAAVWVKADTIHGNRRTQSLFMYWGRPGAEDISDPGAVFGATGGAMAGVWHLGDTGVTSSDGFADATGNGNRGTGQGLGDTSAAAGLIGGAARFAGKGQSIRIPDSPTLKLGSGSFTLSAWVWAESLTGKHQILAKRAEPAGDYELQALRDGRLVGYPGPPGSGSVGLEGKASLATGRWHHVAFVREGNRIRLYLDGQEDLAATTGSGNVDCDSALYIGRDGTANNEEWVGLLDEVRVTPRAHSADWLKLCHRNQAPGATFPAWRRFP